MRQEVAPSLFAMMTLVYGSFWYIVEVLLNVRLGYASPVRTIALAVAGIVRNARIVMVEDIAHITGNIIAQSVQSLQDVINAMRSLDA